MGTGRPLVVLYNPVAGFHTIPLALIALGSALKAEGVDVRIIGKAGKRGGDLRVQKLESARLHVRAMVRDGDAAFVGSQSLRAVELDARREVGLIVRDPKVVKQMLEVFEEDWETTGLGDKDKKAEKDPVVNETVPA